MLIADDQALIRVGLRKILAAQPGTEIVGEAEDGAKAVTLAQLLRPDVALMDIRMPLLDGIEATRKIVAAQHETRVLILTTFGLAAYVYKALRAGASGFMRGSRAVGPGPFESADLPAAHDQRGDSQEPRRSHTPQA